MQYDATLDFGSFAIATFFGNCLSWMELPCLGQLTSTNRSTREFQSTVPTTAWNISEGPSYQSKNTAQLFPLPNPASFPSLHRDRSQDLTLMDFLHHHLLLRVFPQEPNRWQFLRRWSMNGTWDKEIQQDWGKTRTDLIGSLWAFDGLICVKWQTMISQL